jgi:hypothetical protein
MNQDEVIQKIVMDEIAGKNLAIHSYDKMIWMIRSGFLTLFGAGWGIFFKSIADNIMSNFLLFRENLVLLRPVFIALLLISFALGIGGFTIDQCYVRRKFRVIHALDQILQAMVEKKDPGSRCPEEIMGYLRVSGDKDDQTYALVTGYRVERMNGLIIYFIPLIVVSVCVTILWGG